MEAKSTQEQEKRRVGPIRRFLSALGPGVVTGAADDDPSGIVTYSMAGAQLGTALLWMALLTFPLLATVQMMCARIGMVTGSGLTTALRKKFPRWVLVLVAVALFIANTINIGADLSGMGDVIQLTTGIDLRISVLVIGIFIIFATIRFRYVSIAAVLKWLAAMLLAYVVTAFVIRPDWGHVLVATFTPAWPTDHAYLSMIVAILGTTISPYLFFWQASQEIEEERAHGRRTVVSRRNATQPELNDRAMDVGTGAFFSNLVMYFIILTTALTLHAHGITRIETSGDAVRALTPLAGSFAAALFSLGLLGVGFLAIPTLAGSSAYVLAETFGFREGLDEKLLRARFFYGVMTVSILLGMAMPFLKVRPVDALYGSAVINGVLAPFLLLAVLLIASDRVIMRNQPSPPVARWVVGLTMLGMSAAALALFVL